MSDNVTKIINGKEISATLRAKIAQKVAAHIDNGGQRPGLAVILVGEDPASAVYVRNKHKACEEVGVYSEVIKLPESTTQNELLAVIDSLNNNSDIHGILVQLPLPKHIDKQTVINAISADKDVDAFHPVNIGKVMTGDYKFAPCTPAGVMYLLKASGVSTEGKHCVVIGRSDIVGKPMAMLMLHSGATITVCHSRTRDLAGVCRDADILVSAVGKAGFVTADMVKDGAVVVDVGINRLPDGKLAGDVAYDEVAPKASYITPVPGGVGPMTIAMLLMNTLAAADIELPD
ncbi:MAG: bifunctional methylenetetrahydrofolate dehydrogenase/methenyltetrahydrofolate cyclohydrolase FolD [Clostridia bacterium]|nr:bifunctional methylenetetrahydrofolate dehydrogenase/methenyltetrahydrofolate cyclohydrolase FolD [Clostridia bacterium]